MKLMKSICASAGIAAAMYAFSTPSWSQTRLWGTYHGGDGVGIDAAHGVAVDRDGFVYVVGYTWSTGGIVKGNAFDSNKVSASVSSGYLSKFAPDGKLVWSTYYGDKSIGDAELRAVELDSDGNIYVAGNVQCPSVGLATPNASQTSCAAGVGKDIYLAKFNASGQRMWGSYFGGNADDEIRGLSVTGTGVYVVGLTHSSQGLVVAPSADLSLGGAEDGVVAKFDLFGKKLWSRYYGGEAIDSVNGIACSSSVDLLADVCYLVGYTQSKNGLATPGAHDAVLSGVSDGFIARIRGNDGVRDWGTYYGGESFDGFFNGIVVGKKLNVYAVGQTYSSSGIAMPNAFKVVMGGPQDNFIVKFDANGIRQAATYFGEDVQQADEYAFDLAIDDAGSIYALSSASGIGGGGTQATPGAYDTTLDTMSSDAVITKFDSSLNRKWGTYYGGSEDDYWMWGGIAVYRNNTVYVVNGTGSPDAMATPGAHKTMLGYVDAFIVKFFAQ